MNIRFAESRDMELLAENDKHISKKEILNSIRQNRIYIAEVNKKFAGWMRYSLFWDSIPFMNLLYVMEEYRGKGYGRQIVMFWEKEMKEQGYRTLMTSTQADEYAQHFYFKLGYEAVGGFRLEDDPYEIIFAKIR